MSAPAPPRPARQPLSGPRRGRLLATGLLLSALLMTLLIVNSILPGNIVALDMDTHLAIFPWIAPADVVVSVVVAGWLITPRRPAAIVVRTLTVLLALV